MSYSNPHELIERENSYNIHKKLLTIHSNDRDTKHYQNSNEFAIKCPTSYTNIQSIIVNDLSIPLPIYNFSENLFNNIFRLQVSATGDLDIITIPNGHYTPNNLAKILQDIFDEKTNNSPTIRFKIFFNTIKSKFFIFSNNSINIQNYTDYPCGANLVNTGSLYHMGFNSDASNNISKSSIFSQDQYYKYVDVSSHNITDMSYVCEADYMYRFLNTEPIYMEFDKHNIYDELNPYPAGSNNLYNNFCNSSVNTAFLKIPPNGYNQISTRQYNNIISFNPPILRLNTLKFKFRYHDGRLVDLGDQDINFTLEFIQLRGEIPQHLNIRMPVYK